MKEIKLTNSDRSTIVDDEDFENHREFAWRESEFGYAVRCKAINKRSHTILIHREITNAPKGLSVDHINGDPLDNRKSNLRIVTHAQNMYNMKAKSGNISGYKGVSWHSLRGKWRARVFFKGKETHLGLFVSKEEAALAYNEKAKELFGEYARLNVIKEESA